MRWLNYVMIMVLMFIVSGCGQAKVETRNGITIGQNSPDQAYISYYELFNSKNPMDAYDLISPQNKKKASKKDFSEWIKTLPYKGEKLVYTTSAINGDIAIVGSIKLITAYNKKQGVFSIYSMVKEDDKWYMEMNPQGLSKEKVKDYDKLTDKVLEKTEKSIKNEEFILDKSYLGQIKSQVAAFKQKAEKNTTNAENK